MSGIVTLRVNLIRNGISALHLKAPVYLSSPSEPLYGEKLVFTGLSTRHDGSQTDCGGIEAYRNAAFSVIDYLGQFGFTREQVYVLLAVAPVETRVVATANKPNLIVSIGVPLGIFDMDIRPSASSGRR
jgi:formamidase